MADADFTQQINVNSVLQRLAIRTESGQSRTLPLKRPFIIGRAAGCDLQIEDPHLSRRHASIRFDGSSFWLENLSKTNCTRLDGIEIEQARLRQGLWIELGRQRLQVIQSNRRIDRSKEQATREMHADMFGDADLRPLVGRSKSFLRVREELCRVAKVPAPLPVLLRGETGTGKELFARELHERSAQKNAPFVVLNCAAIPDNLAESELFGHRQGAFSGAHRDHKGAFERAQGGTLFLDEIGELPLNLQAKLLRVLEAKHYSPVGSEKENLTDARVIAATHRNLEAMVRAGNFREDLYHRLSVLTLQLPALRDRKDDIPLLLQRFSRELENSLGRPIQISSEATDAASQYPWPGNIRALKNALCRAAVHSTGEISANDLLPPAANQVLPRTSNLQPSDLKTIQCDGDYLTIPRGDYASMHYEMLAQVIADSGSIRSAAEKLGVPKSTLSARMRRATADAKRQKAC